MTIRGAIWWLFNEVKFIDWVAYTLIGVSSAVLIAYAVVSLFYFFKWLIGG